jgi:hypothetical protein
MRAREVIPRPRRHTVTVTVTAEEQEVLDRMFKSLRGLTVRELETIEKDIHRGVATVKGWRNGS